VRLPAHFSGVYGLKPTYGRIPIGRCQQRLRDHMGTLTRTVADSALMLEAMAGPHPVDHTSCELSRSLIPGFWRAT